MPPAACETAPQHEIFSRSINFGELRQQLKLGDIREHYDPEATDILIDPQVIVVHWTATPTLESLCVTFEPDTLALAWLKEAFDAGERRWIWIEMRPMFDSIRGEPEYRGPIARMKAEIEEMRRRVEREEIAAGER